MNRLRRGVPKTQAQDDDNDIVFFGSVSQFGLTIWKTGIRDREERLVSQTWHWQGQPYASIYTYTHRQFSLSLIRIHI